MGKTLTISIAAYNVEKYIRKTLDSLIDDSIIDDLEIFVVDDGGTDKTLDIAKEYAERYPQSIFPVHKENGGYGSTINKSIELATGKYFKQLDGDDWYDTENLEDLIHVMKEISVDCILTDFTKYNEVSGDYTYINLYDSIQDGEYKLSESGIKKQLSMYASAFRTSILQNMPNRLSEHCFYTDIEYSALPIPYIDTVYVFHKPIYVYRTGADGQSMNVEGIKKHYREHEIVFWRLIDIYHTIPTEKKTNREIFHALLVHRMSEYYNFLCILPLSLKPEKEMRTFTQKAKDECPDILNAAMERYRSVKALVKTRGLAYPAFNVWTRINWKQSGRLG